MNQLYPHDGNISSSSSRLTVGYDPEGIVKIKKQRLLRNKKHHWGIEKPANTEFMATKLQLKKGFNT